MQTSTDSIFSLPSAVVGGMPIFSGKSCTFMLMYYHIHIPLSSCFCYTASKMVKLHSTVTIPLSADREILWKLACKTDALHYKHQRMITLICSSWMASSQPHLVAFLEPMHCSTTYHPSKIWISTGTCMFPSSEANEELNTDTTSHSAWQDQSKPVSLPLPQP